MPKTKQKSTDVKEIELNDGSKTIVDLYDYMYLRELGPWKCIKRKRNLNEV